MRSWMIAFALGVLFLDISPSLPPRLFCWLAVTAALLFLFMRHWLPRLASGCVLGVAWAALHGHTLLDHRMPEGVAPRAMWVEGVVVDLPRRADSFGRPVQHFVLRVSRESDDGRHWRAPGLLNVSLRWRGTTPVRAGEVWRLAVARERPHAEANPGGFDFEAYQFARGISASGKVESGQRVAPAPAFSLGALRQRIHDGLQAALAGQAFGRLAPALVLGVGDELSADDWSLLQRTGTMHLFVVSGLQIGLVAAAVFGCVRALARWWPSRMLLWLPAQQMAAVAAACAALAYSLLAGFTLPTQRSAVIVLLAALLPALSRRVSIGHAACMALFVVLLLDPLCPLFPSVWLSFGAAAILVYGFAGRLRGQPWWCVAFHGQWIASLGMLPLLAFMFGIVAWVSPLANLLALPVINLVALPCAALASMLSLLSPQLAAWSWMPADWAMAFLWDALNAMSQSEGAVAWTGRPPVILSLLALAGVLWVLAPRGSPARGLGLLLLLPACMQPASGIEPGAFRAVVLDVGQGLAVHVQTAGHQLLFDTGRVIGEDGDSGHRVLLPYLRQSGRRPLDVLVLSHDDDDHTGGAGSLLAEAGAEQIYGGEAVDGIELRHCRAGMHWRWEGVDFEFINPEVEAAGNDSSCVLRVSSAAGSILIPGDIGAKVETQLLYTALDKLRADVLIAPHHGSRFSSSQRFANVVAPAWVVFSAGRGNLYGHPHPSVVSRYQGLGARTLETARTGAITFDFLPGQAIAPQAWRRQIRRYWSSG